jgi:hypothetical protein
LAVYADLPAGAADAIALLRSRAALAADTDLAAGTADGAAHLLDRAALPRDTILALGTADGVALLRSRAALLPDTGLWRRTGVAVGAASTTHSILRPGLTGLGGRVAAAGRASAVERLATPVGDFSTLIGEVRARLRLATRARSLDTVLPTRALLADRAAETAVVVAARGLARAYLARTAGAAPVRAGFTSTDTRAPASPRALRARRASRPEHGRIVLRDDEGSDAAVWSS